MVYITVHSLCCMFCGFEQMYNDMCAFQVVLMVKNPSANAGDVRDVGLIPGLGRSPGGSTAPTPVFLPGESHGLRSLTGYSS